MLELEELLIRLGTFELRATMALREGRRYAVIGPSGAGKSSLLNAICGFLPVAGGSVRVKGRDITADPPGQRPMTMLFQDNNLFPHLTLRQNVGLGLRPNLRLTAEDEELVAAALARVQLGDHAEKLPAALSGGQQSRAALARVLVQARPWVLLDEPFAALGPALRAEMLDLVENLVAETGAGLLMITHSPEDVRRIAEEAIFVADGRAEAPMSAADLLNDPPPALRVYLG
ncbi:MULTISPECIES: thiamine ABC transporter ATP-binding protein [unclassified Sulfitobacter]|uniref:thiamine ABC transporter ATP-binding protein n=1 Tax=unclassified Sulfitobacter TaxID=196795 RepID=UPI0007C2CB34|nr:MULTISPECIES: ATP-binding cassette domain-containing protein [unclassified Sulfitobacter]KZY04005.1 thiamine ABC transporter ATP-binding protein [Sulfitobacter sp. HI0023]KZY26227.1 thiamine ABC transporter ATP-binding protein [Sulfitobacter sp. HI0040]KZZ68519.1 thiamine ABC transporter ATP-binding protein [Sulfitobacter sp. HI0129]